jgi:hypothetical protein
MDYVSDARCGSTPMISAFLTDVGADRPAHPGWVVSAICKQSGPEVSSRDHSPSVVHRLLHVSAYSSTWASSIFLWHMQAVCRPCGKLCSSLRKKIDAF